MSTIELFRFFYLRGHGLMWINGHPSFVHQCLRCTDEYEGVIVDFENMARVYTGIKRGSGVVSIGVAGELEDPDEDLPRGHVAHFAFKSPTFRDKCLATMGSANLYSTIFKSLSGQLVGEMYFAGKEKILRDGNFLAHIHPMNRFDLNPCLDSVIRTAFHLTSVYSSFTQRQAALRKKSLPWLCIDFI